MIYYSFVTIDMIRKKDEVQLSNLPDYLSLLYTTSRDIPKSD